MKQWLLDVAYLPLKCHVLPQCWETPLNEPWDCAKSVNRPRKSFMSWNWWSQMNDHTYTVAASPFNLVPSKPLKIACWIINDKDRYMNVPSWEDSVTSLFNRIHAMHLDWHVPPMWKCAYSRTDQSLKCWVWTPVYSGESVSFAWEGRCTFLCTFPSLHLRNWWSHEWNVDLLKSCAPIMTVINISLTLTSGSQNWKQTHHWMESPVWPRVHLHHEDFVELLLSRVLHPWPCHWRLNQRTWAEFRDCTWKYSWPFEHCH